MASLVSLRQRSGSDKSVLQAVQDPRPARAGRFRLDRAGRCERHFRACLTVSIKPPDLLLIDGGQGPALGGGRGRCEGIGMQQQPIASIEKGEEKLFVPGRESPVPLQAAPRCVTPGADGPRRGASFCDYLPSGAAQRRPCCGRSLDEIPGIRSQAAHAGTCCNTSVPWPASRPPRRSLEELVHAGRPASGGRRFKQRSSGHRGARDSI